jgi:tagatose-1,6-bisphosphate aldolase
MATWAEFPDGVSMSEEVFKTLARFAPGGTMDVFASDQHNSYLKLAGAYYKHIGQDRPGTDEDVTEICRRFARGLRGASTAALFNQLAFASPGFRQLLGDKVMLIGRLEDTNTAPTADGKGQIAQLSVEPEQAADKVDGFKTLVKLDPSHKESWEKNKEWLASVYERARKLDKPLFNETLLFQRKGESKLGFARRLPEDLVKMAQDFSPYGDFYKTQVPVLWSEDDSGAVTRVSRPDVIRKCAQEMFNVVDRPMLLLSAAVDFPQYAAQYAIVSDLFAGPMCGRAYFKECFTMPDTRDWDSLEANFRKVAIPRIEQIKALCRVVSQPWWHKFSSMTTKAKTAINTSAKPAGSGVKADYGY